MHRYKAFGLNIASEFPLPELQGGYEQDADVIIQYGTIQPPTFDHCNQHFKAERTDRGHLYYIQNIGGVKVEEGARITVSPLDGSEERGFRFLVSGIALGLLLHQRGFVTLHASAVSFEGEVIAFVGHKGMGKSTTAAAFHAHDYSIVTDDLLVLDVEGDRALARPGFPHLKLYPESIEGSLAKDPTQVPKIDPDGTKRSYDAARGFVSRSQVLQCMYVLDYKGGGKGGGERNGRPCSETIRGGDACMEIVRHSYVARLIPDEALSRRHLERCATFARKVPMRRLYREKSLAHLPSVVRHVQEEQGVGVPTPDG